VTSPHQSGRSPAINPALSPADPADTETTTIPWDPFSVACEVKVAVRGSMIRRTVHEIAPLFMKGDLASLLIALVARVEPSDTDECSYTPIRE